MLALLLFALLRIKRPEALKEHAPADLGRMLGLDRAPEVKTLRRKLRHLARLGKAEVFGRKLAKLRLKRHGRALAFLYVDGHVRVYHGRRRIGKAHVTRMRLSLPATTDFWVNDKQGDPVLVLTAEVNPSVAAMMVKILAQVTARDVGPRSPCRGFRPRRSASTAGEFPTSSTTGTSGCLEASCAFARSRGWGRRGTRPPS